jgi:hypothetical protein
VVENDYTYVEKFFPNIDKFKYTQPATDSTTIEAAASAT